MEANAFLQSEQVKQFSSELEKVNLGPLWHAIPQLMNHQPKPEAVPYLWKWELLHAKLMEASTIFTPDRGGERRAIYIQNPGLAYKKPWGWASATQTLYAAIQLILPGETAPSHRHTQSALRFISKGKGAYSIVDGERLYMEEGDFLTTPGGLWHGHSHPGTEPMFWLDCLDIPFMYGINGTFFESYPDHIQQPERPDDYSAWRYRGGMVRPISDRTEKKAPLGLYKWKPTAEALEGLSRFEPDPYDGVAVEYFNPSNGKNATPNIASWMQKLPRGFEGLAHRHTHSVIYHVFRGSGTTVIDGTRFDWSQGDIFVVPPWALHEHANTGTEDALLFSASDLPLMERLDLVRGETYERNRGRQEVTGRFSPILP
ncbi:cupin domain-containing protein [Cohnella caldifontis]|uniref:cupin domain-containing protein n=1 Tax=Cohnella caldifontis TaxID=3027471 RepID=UPI0023EC55A6|nr:cupin domain-containing protein [Cohnella sp. YIM B05605]